MTTDAPLPPRPEMLQAFLDRDPSYEGIFVTGVKTTGIFCRPTCPARKPRVENVEFFPGPRQALVAGYRPCCRCRPLRPAGGAPSWLRPLLREVEDDPTRRWSDQDLRDMGLHPARVRRWFKTHYGMTFHAYSRARRLGEALGRIREGDGVSRAAFDAGYDSLSGFGEAFRTLTGQPPTEVADGPVVRVTRMTTPLGPVVAGATEEAVVLLEFADRTALPRQVSGLARRTGWVFAPGSTPVLRALREALDAYFAGDEKAQAELYAILRPVKERVDDLAEEERDAFRSTLQEFVRTFAFLSQVLPYQDAELEGLYIFGRYLSRYIRPDKDPSPMDIQDQIGPSTPPPRRGRRRSPRRRWSASRPSSRSSTTATAPGSPRRTASPWRTWSGGSWTTPPSRPP